MRQSAKIDGDFVVFLIGMRINKLRAVRQWFSVAREMVPMLKELRADPSRGLLGVKTFFNGRNIMMVQYWRSMEHLLRYARDPEAHHWPAWKRFYQRAYESGAVGIWHETYAVSGYETIYGNMPPFGLGAAAELVPTRELGNRSADRLAASGWSPPRQAPDRRVPDATATRS